MNREMFQHLSSKDRQFITIPDITNGGVYVPAMNESFNFNPPGQENLW